MKLLKTIFFALVITVLFTSCAKEYSSETILPATGSWEFDNGAVHYSGYLDTIYQTTGIGSNVLYILGKTDDRSQYFQLKLSDTSFAPRTYYSSQNHAYFNYSVPVKTIYNTSPLNGEFTVDLIVLDSAKIQGTFSGTVRDSSNNLIQITNGKFTTF